MAIASTTTNVDLLKRIYGNSLAKRLYGKAKLLSDCKKDTKFVGENKTIAVNIGNTTGFANDFAAARAAMNPTTNKKFLVIRRKAYSTFQISNELVQAGRDIGAFVDQLKHETDGALGRFSDGLARQVWGNAGGSIGRIDTTTNLASTTLKLRVRQDIVGLFDYGAQLSFSADDGTPLSPAGERGAPDYLTVVGIDRDAGTLTMSAALNTVSGITVNDYVFVRGTYGLALSGYRAWHPATAPTSGDSFFGLDRSVDAQRLSGTRVSGGGGNKEDTIQAAGSACIVNGIDPKKLYAHPDDVADIIKALGSKVNLDADQSTGAKSMKIYIGAGEGQLDLRPEAFVTKGTAYMSDPSRWVFCTAGEAPMNLTKGLGPLGLMRTQDADTWEGQLGAYGNFYDEDPGAVCIITW